MIRTEKHKMIVYPAANMVRLYDVQKDPLEMHDLADNPEYAGKQQNLFKELTILQKAMSVAARLLR